MAQLAHLGQSRRWRNGCSDEDIGDGSAIGGGLP
jgi:hypothetical protein